MVQYTLSLYLPPAAQNKILKPFSSPPPPPPPPPSPHTFSSPPSPPSPHTFYYSPGVLPCADLLPSDLQHAFAAHHCKRNVLAHLTNTWGVILVKLRNEDLNLALSDFFHHLNAPQDHASKDYFSTGVNSNQFIPKPFPFKNTLYTSGCC